ncbi:MAG TPA: rRNA maturation RNase YbeY [Rhizomicrobium sp.]|jgi:probable rRNA maturation factor
MSTGSISIVVEEPRWKTSGVAVARVRSAARLALARASVVPRARANEEKNPELTLLLTHDERLRALNAQFRGKDTPTNVLSFPAADGAGSYLGDVAIAFGVTTRESAISGLSMEHHTLHLAVHGVLHLLGYDHVRSREARIMERLEVDILAELGIPSPYDRATTAT